LTTRAAKSHAFFRALSEAKLTTTGQITSYEPCHLPIRKRAKNHPVHKISGSFKSTGGFIAHPQSRVTAVTAHFEFKPFAVGD
jgi:hypothetical protein